MSFAPFGMRGLTRKAFSHTNSGVKSLRNHAPVSRGPVGAKNFSTHRVVSQSAHSVFTHSRNLLSRFFSRLLAPNLRIPLHPSLSGRALHTSITHARLGRTSIQQGISFPVRNAVSRPLGFGTHFPRAPALTPRVATNVGIGSVRTFTSGRPLFQNLVENVPIAVRALCEADLDGAKPTPKHFSGGRTTTTTSTTRSSSKQMQKAKPLIHKPQNESFTAEPTTPSEELECYFSTPVPAVTTYLLVPLAPTPTSRMPLGAYGVDNSTGSPTLLHPLAELGSLHMSHELHSLRASSLFSRLDHGDVWNKGVRCSAFSHGNGHIADGEGTCTILKLEFVGWTLAQVKSVIGECGTGWCVMHEEREDEHTEVDFDISSELDETSPDPSIDPAQSLVFPTLDISSDSAASLTRPQSAMSTTSSSLQLSSPGFDSWEDIRPPGSSDSGGVGFEHSRQRSACSNDDGWYALGLSSQFLDRAHF